MGSLLEKSANFNSKIKTTFEGGDLTSDGGLLLYKEFDDLAEVNHCLSF